MKVNGDQEIFVVSVLSHKQIFRCLFGFVHICTLSVSGAFANFVLLHFRHLESASQVYRKDLVMSQEEGLVSAGPFIHKEKKKVLNMVHCIALVGPIWDCNIK